MDMEILNIVADSVASIDPIVGGAIAAGTIATLGGIHIYKKKKKQKDQFDDEDERQEISQILHNPTSMTEELDNSLSLETKEFEVDDLHDPHEHFEEDSDDWKQSMNEHIIQENNAFHHNEAIVHPQFKEELSLRDVVQDVQEEKTTKEQFLKDDSFVSPLAKNLTKEPSTDFKGIGQNAVATSSGFNGVANTPKSLWDKPADNVVVDHSLDFNSRELVEAAITFDEIHDRENSLHYLQEAVEKETHDKEKLRLKIILNNYTKSLNEGTTGQLSKIVEKLPTFYRENKVHNAVVAPAPMMEAIEPVSPIDASLTNIIDPTVHENNFNQIVDNDGVNFTYEPHIEDSQFSLFNETKAPATDEQSFDIIDTINNQHAKLFNLEEPSLEKVEDIGSTNLLSSIDLISPSFEQSTPLLVSESTTHSQVDEPTVPSIGGLINMDDVPAISSMLKQESKENKEEQNKEEQDWLSQYSFIDNVQHSNNMEESNDKGNVDNTTTNNTEWLDLPSETILETSNNTTNNVTTEITTEQLPHGGENLVSDLEEEFPWLNQNADFDTSSVDNQFGKEATIEDLIPTLSVAYEPNVLKQVTHNTDRSEQNILPEEDLIPVLHDVLEVEEKPAENSLDSLLMSLSKEAQEQDLLMEKDELEAQEMLSEFGQQFNIDNSAEQKQLSQFEEHVLPQLEPLNIVDKKNQHTQDNSSFLEEFGQLMNQIHSEVNSQQAEKEERIENLLSQESPNTAKPFKQSVWVNWMLQASGKATMKHSVFELDGKWGSKTAVDQLKELLNKEAGTNATGQQNTWGVLSVFPLEE